MRNKSSFCLIFNALLILLTANTLEAVTWDGGAATTNWNDALNWSNDLVPTAADVVEIGAGFTVDISVANAVAHDLTLTSSTLNITATGLLTIDIGSSNYALTLDDATFVNNGNLTITNCNSGILLKGATATLLDNNATLKIINHNGHGIRAETNACTIDNAGMMSMDIGTSSTSAAISYGFAQPSFTNSGTINIGATSNAGSGIAPSFGGSYSNSGTINIFNTGAGKPALGSGFIPPAWNNSTSGIINLKAGIGGPIIANFNLALKNDGKVNVDKVGAVSVIVSGTGSFAGTQVFSTNNEVKPGNSAGCLTFSKGLTIDNNGSTTAKTTIEIGGATPCTQYDKINVTGTATIDGDLFVTLINGFTPAVNQTFVLLEATSLNGTYVVTHYDTPNITWTTSYNATSVIARVVSVLPVELSHFTASPNENNAVQLNWRTASESNNEGFVIERSTDGSRWSELGFVVGAGTSPAPQSYFFEDIKPFSSHSGGCKGGCINYYRLRQMDFDGQSEYSRVVSIDFPSRTGFGMEALDLYPNPTKGIINIKGKYSPFAHARIFNANGKLVLQKNMEGTNQINISNEPNGLYFLEIIDENKVLAKRLVKQQ